MDEKRDKLERSWNKLSPTQLKNVLNQLGLPDDGEKSELVSRVIEYEVVRQSREELASNSIPSLNEEDEESSDEEVVEVTIESEEEEFDDTLLDSFDEIELEVECIEVTPSASNTPVVKPELEDAGNNLRQDTRQKSPPPNETEILTSTGIRQQDKEVPSPSALTKPLPKLKVLDFIKETTRSVRNKDQMSLEERQRAEYIAHLARLKSKGKAVKPSTSASGKVTPSGEIIPSAETTPSNFQNGQHVPPLVTSQNAQAATSGVAYLPPTSPTLNTDVKEENPNDNELQLPREKPVVDRNSGEVIPSIEMKNIEDDYEMGAITSKEIEIDVVEVGKILMPPFEIAHKECRGTLEACRVYLAVDKDTFFNDVSVKDAMKSANNVKVHFGSKQKGVVAFDFATQGEAVKCVQTCPTVIGIDELHNVLLRFSDKAEAANLQRLICDDPDFVKRIVYITDVPDDVTESDLLTDVFKSALNISIIPAVNGEKRKGFVICRDRNDVMKYCAEDESVKYRDQEIQTFDLWRHKTVKADVEAEERQMYADQTYHRTLSDIPDLRTRRLLVEALHAERCVYETLYREKVAVQKRSVYYHARIQRLQHVLDIHTDMLLKRGETPPETELYHMTLKYQKKGGYINKEIVDVQFDEAKGKQGEKRAKVLVSNKIVKQCVGAYVDRHMATVIHEKGTIQPARSPNKRRPYRSLQNAVANKKANNRASPTHSASHSVEQDGYSNNHCTQNVYNRKVNNYNNHSGYHAQHNHNNQQPLQNHHSVQYNHSQAAQGYSNQQRHSHPPVFQGEPSNNPFFKMNTKFPRSLTDQTHRTYLQKVTRFTREAAKRVAFHNGVKKEYQGYKKIQRKNNLQYQKQNNFAA